MLRPVAPAGYCARPVPVPLPLASNTLPRMRMPLRRAPPLPLAASTFGPASAPGEHGPPLQRQALPPGLEALVATWLRQDPDEVTRGQVREYERVGETVTRGRWGMCLANQSDPLLLLDACEPEPLPGKSDIPAVPVMQIYWALSKLQHESGHNSKGLT